jgi:hypothetical protein
MGVSVEDTMDTNERRETRQEVSASPLVAMRRRAKKLDRTRRLRYPPCDSLTGKMTCEGRLLMQKMLGLLIALSLLLAIAGTAMAECGSGHTDTAQPAPTKPLPQS